MTRKRGTSEARIIHELFLEINGNSCLKKQEGRLLIGVALPFRFAVYDLVGAVETRHVTSLHVPKSFHLFNDSNALCANAVFGSDADHVDASVELGHVDDLLFAFDFSIINHLTED